MSFSSAVKNELSMLGISPARHCLIAEIYAIANFNLTAKEAYGKKTAYISTENRYAAIRFDSLLRSAFDINSGVSVKKHIGKPGCSYFLFLSGLASEKILGPSGMYGRKFDVIDRLTIKNECCKRAYLRGAFISCGSVSDPEKNYHMEFVCQDGINEQVIFELAGFYELDPKRIKRRNTMVVYFKGAEAISTLLSVMGAHASLMAFESVRVVKDVSNNINRKVNCETANLSKTINASVINEMDIRYIENNGGLSFLPKRLREIAELRLQYPDISLREIGMLTTPPISKSGVNHRLRKIAEIAEILRGDKL